MCNGINNCRDCNDINTGNLREHAFDKLGGEGDGLALLVERGPDVEGMQDGRYGDPNGCIAEVLSRADPASVEVSWLVSLGSLSPSQNPRTTHRRPYPNVNVRGSRTAGFSVPSPVKYRSGMNASGSG